MRHSVCEFMALCSQSNGALPERSQPSAGARIRTEPSSAAEGLDLHKLLLCYVMSVLAGVHLSCFPQAVTCCFASSYRDRMPLNVFLQSLSSKFICLKKTHPE